MSTANTGSDQKRQYFINFNELGKYAFNNTITTADGKVVKGDKIYVGLVTKNVGSGSQPHRHSFEQFNYVLKGVLKAMVEGEERMVQPGELIHIPANALHTTMASRDGDCVYLMIKEVTPFGTSGVPENPNVKGPRYEPGFEPKQ